MRVEELFAFIKERHNIYVRRQSNQAKPWTDDPILQNYRFCNVYRELDTQTKWLAENWRDPNCKDKDLWFACLVFRFVNWHETAEEFGYPVPWDGKKFFEVLSRRATARKKVYSSAYMISTHGVKQSKPFYLVNSLTKIWGNRENVRPHKNQALEAFHANLKGCFDVGSFIAGQVVADIKYTPLFKDSPDWEIFAASGPGSKRGLNRVLRREVNTPWKEDVWRAVHDDLWCKIAPRVIAAGMPRLHAQDLQNCLCEFDKYERVRLGEGRPKSTYQRV